MKTALFYLCVVLMCLSGKLWSQTHQLTGNPVNTTGWDVVPSAIVSGDFIRLTDDLTGQVGGIKLSTPINLKNCDKWAVEFDFRIDGFGTYAYGDGLAFWYLANPPATYNPGDGFGIPDNATGLMVGFDIYNNSTSSDMSQLHLLYGTNPSGSNIEFNNTAGSTFHSPDFIYTPQTFIGSSYKHVVVNGQTDSSNPNNWIIKITIDGNVIVNQSFSPSGSAGTMTQGYFGFSASTGAASARHSIKNVKIYTDKIPILQSAVTRSFCPGTNTVDLTSFNTQFTSNPGNYNFTYYIQGSSTPIIDPAHFQFSANTTVVVSIKDPSLLLCDNPDGTIQLNITQVATPAITTTSSTLCHSGSITLTSSQATGNTWSTGATTPSITVTAPGNYTLTHTVAGCTSQPASITIAAEPDPAIQIAGNLVLCESPTQLTASAAGTGNIYSWSNGSTGNTTSVSAAGTYTVTVKTAAGCIYQKSVNVTQGIVPVVHNTSLSKCSNASTATFDLTSAQGAITSTPGTSFDYYLSQADALAGNTNTIPNPSAHVSGNTVVYVRVKSASCAKVAELQLNITTTATPTINASSNTICYGGNVTLTSNQTAGNLWSTGATTQSITVTSPGTYTLTSTVTGCSSLPASVTIATEPDPNVQIAGNLVLCESPTQLTASAAGTGNVYTWSNGSTGASISTSTAGTYTVTVRTAAGCIYQKSVSVTQGVVPVVQNTSLSECSNGSTATFNLTSAQAAITSTPGTSFDYYLSQTDAVAGNTNTIPNPSVHVSGNTVIYVRVKSATCAKVAEIRLTVNSKPVPVITASANAICHGNSVTLTSSLPTGNTWSTGETTQTITVSSGGTYTLTNNNGTCTSNPASITIATGTDPNLQIAGSPVFCQGSSTALTASASGTGNSYSWSNGTNTASTTITAPGTYTVAVTTAAGCQYQKTITVTMDPLITVNIAPPTQITCTNPLVTLNATTSVYQPGATFSWTTTTGTIVSGANTLTPVVSNNGTYTLTITSATPRGCVKQASVTVTKNTTPPTVILSAPRFTICQGESVDITAGGGLTYTWTGLSGTGNVQTVSPSATTTYSVTGTAANGCTTTSTITINVVPAIVSALHDIEACPGDQVTLDAGAGPNYSYKWNTGATTRTISPTTPGTYTVTISNGYCSKIFSAVLTHIPKPEITEIIYKDNTLTINAKNKGSMPLEYSIDGGFTWQPSHIFHSISRNTKYSVYVRNKGTYCYTISEYFTFFMSNVITPNSDGINDVIDFSSISKYGNFEGSIFDRYGMPVFKINSKNPIWDGKYLNAPLPTGTYWYRLFWEDRISKKPVEISGWVLLKNRN
ncbi:MAG: T9SS type B sorting domain-containing protein [Chryseobacterium sp.]|jgi:gliding motility-associated-like protein|uniref:T9SS type B sorting domain-containing protein n=1 Tax=Chryseobacterium sp. TaxID=1871047 RepID=UPI00282163FF|nr:T9SS type B sorting domain-containing protein [Chryseobacterium sp.]MDR2236711.1 T9SS type B sorting domain-containing protein [Chryseobacterium sp.]